MLPMTFGQLFKRTRKDHLHLTQIQLAEVLGISQGLISKIECDEIEPTSSVYFTAKCLAAEHSPEAYRLFVDFEIQSRAIILAARD